MEKQERLGLGKAVVVAKSKIEKKNRNRVCKRDAG